MITAGFSGLRHFGQVSFIKRSKDMVSSLLEPGNPLLRETRACPADQIRDESAYFSRATQRRQFGPIGKSVIDEAPEYPRSARMLELSDRLCLDLSNPLACQRKLLAHFFQRVVTAHAETKAHAYDSLLARG